MKISKINMCLVTLVLVIFVLISVQVYRNNCIQTDNNEFLDKYISESKVSDFESNVETTDEGSTTISSDTSSTLSSTDQESVKSNPSTFIDDTNRPTLEFYNKFFTYYNGLHSYSTANSKKRQKNLRARGYNKLIKRKKRNLRKNIRKSKQSIDKYHEDWFKSKYFKLYADMSEKSVSSEIMISENEQQMSSDDSSYIETAELSEKEDVLKKSIISIDLNLEQEENVTQQTRVNLLVGPQPKFYYEITHDLDGDNSDSQ